MITNPSGRKAMIDTVTIVIIVIFLMATLMLIYYQIGSSVKTKERVLSITSRLNRRVVIPNAVLNAPCISQDRGVISLQKFRDNRCGLDCLSLRKGVQVKLSSPVLSQKCPKDFKGDWGYKSSYPVVIVNETSGNRYPAQISVKS